jgi:hypothetical protein
MPDIIRYAIICQSPNCRRLTNGPVAFFLDGDEGKKFEKHVGKIAGFFSWYKNPPPWKVGHTSVDPNTVYLAILFSGTGRICFAYICTFPDSFLCCGLNFGLCYLLAIVFFILCTRKTYFLSLCLN